MEKTSKTATNRRKNSVHIVGYLKENTLEKMKDKNQNDIIRGALTIAVDEINSIRLSFYTRKLKKDGSSNKDYERLITLLPQNTTTIANYLAANSTANFATASNMATKLWARGSMEEYVSVKDGKERSMVTFRGASADFKKATDAFIPHAQFEADIYIEKMNPEMTRASAEDSPEETGRLIVTGIIPNWDGNGFRIDFIAPVDNNVAEHIQDNYHIGETATIKGDLISIQLESTKSNVSNENWFGKPREAVKTTTFKRERVINGGSAISIPDGEPGCISKEDIRSCLATRELKIAQTAEKDRVKNAATPEALAADPTNISAVPGAQFDDVDF